MPALIVAGSPIIPPLFLGIYLIATLGATFWLRSLQRRKSFWATAIIVQLFSLGAIVAIAGYVLIPPPHVIKTKVSQTIEITFDHPVSRSVLEKTISPIVAGMWMFEDPVYATHLYRKLVFYPTISTLEAGTAYTVTLANISNVLKTSGKNTYSFSFTKPPLPKGAMVASSKQSEQVTVRLEVPVYLQQHALSCEVSALRMALAMFGVTVSEDELLASVGVDNTPHQGNTWGDPYQAFVGNVNGRQMRDGYGVYWGPIARVARQYRAGSKEFEGWTIDRLTQEITARHPVIIWVYSSGGWPDFWNTADGKRIYAVRDEHTVTVVGFAGDAKNPTHIIVNDPLIGQVWWTKELFEKKWNIFGKSGVVIE